MKLLVIDTNSMSLFMDNDVSFVNPYCKKPRLQVPGEKTLHFVQVEDQTSPLTIVSSFCTTQFKLELFSWDFHFSENIEAQNVVFSARLSYPYLKNASPPPRSWT